MFPQIEDNDGNNRQLLYSQVYNDFAFTYQESQKGTNGYETQHLYFISDRNPVKSGDICINQYNQIGEYKWTGKNDHPSQEGKAGFCLIIDGIIHSDFKLSQLKKIEATTDKFLGINLIPRSFIEEYVKRRGNITASYLKWHNWEAGLGGTLWDPTIKENKTVIIDENEFRASDNKFKYWESVIELINEHRDILAPGYKENIRVFPNIYDHKIILNELENRFGYRRTNQRDIHIDIFSKGVEMGQLIEKGKITTEEIEEHFNKIKF